MHRVFAPHLGHDVVIGACNVRDPHAPSIKLGNYLDHAKLVPTLPDSCDFDEKAMAVLSRLYGNGTYGDCVEAEEGHFIGGVTAYAGTMFQYSDQQILAMYTTLTGFNPADPSTDNGSDPVACANYFVKNPYADGSKLLGVAMVDCTSPSEVRFALSQVGNMKIWLRLPDAYVQNFPRANGFVWDDVGDPNPANGHCIGSGAYNSPIIVGAANAQGVQIRTWALIGTLTWRALAKYCVPTAGGGALTRLTLDWINKGGHTPAGLGLADLVSDCNAMFGTNVPVPTIPSPPPSPSPPLPTPLPVGTAVTLDQAQSFAELGLRQGDPLQALEDAISNMRRGLAAGWPPPTGG